MNKLYTFALLLLPVLASANSDVTALPLWNLDLSRVTCDRSTIIMTNDHSQWIRSASLTRLMRVVALESLYKVEILGGAYVDGTGQIVFLGRRLEDNAIMLNRFSFGEFGSDSSLDLTAQHGAEIYPDNSGWKSAGYSCKL